MRFIRPVFLFLFLIATGLLGAWLSLVHNRVFDFSVLEHYDPGKPSIILDDDGNEWARFAVDRRQPILLSQLPDVVTQAFIAAEDHNFYKHTGISLRGIIRSLCVNVYHGKIIQGASTITQQLVKLLFFDAQKTVSRKIKEQVYALLLEMHFSKEQILQTYLNHVYFGCGIYGIEAASQRFWAIPATQLSVSQAATLAAIVKSPGHYCPLLFPLSAQRRRNVILHSMQRLGFISADICEHAKNDLLMLQSETADFDAPYFKEAVRQLVEELVGRHQLYAGGLTIQTTMRRVVQLQSQEQFHKHIDKLKDSLHDQIDGALLCIETHTGEIKALIGGYDFTQSQFNRALQAKRQLGSIFKPIIYAAALQKQMHFAQTELDEPLTFTQTNNIVWEPHNYSNRFEGEMTLARALSQSNNIITIKTLLNIGCDTVIDLAKKFRIRAELQPYPSLALGCMDVTLAEAAGLFNVFANNGVYAQPHFIRWIKNELGVKIYKPEIDRERVISAATNTQLCSVLGISMDRIKRRYETAWLGCAAICKTGTTNGSRTCWFMGATPSYTTALYIGCDDNQSLGENIFASGTLFPLWFEVTRKLPIEKKDFVYDTTGLQQITVNSKTGLRTAFNDADAITIFVPFNFSC